MWIEKLGDDISFQTQISFVGIYGSVFSSENQKSGHFRIILNNKT